MKITNSNTLLQRPYQKSPPRAKERKERGSQTCFETCHTHDGPEWMIRGGSQGLQVQSHDNVHSLIQHLLSNEAKWNIQINEDIGIIKIKSCGSYAFLNNEHCGYWRGRTGFFSISLAHIPDLIQAEPIPAKRSPWPYRSQPFYSMCVNLREKYFPFIKCPQTMNLRPK